MDYKELCEKREVLKKQLAQIESDIKNYDKLIYKGKLEKAIKLLKECKAYVGGETTIFYSEFECDICDNTMSEPVSLSEIIDRLERVGVYLF